MVLKFGLKNYKKLIKNAQKHLYLIMIDLLIVTGGTRGIGKNIVHNSSSSAKKILAIGSSNLVKRIEDLNKNIFSIKKDLSNINDNFEELRTFLNQHNPSSIALSLCASQLGSHGGLLDADFEEWSNLYKINVLGNLHVLKTTLESIKKDIPIRVVLFGGGGGAYGYPDFSGYALSKVAAIRAAENIGIEFKNSYKNASIVALAPGAVSTEMLAKLESYGAEVKTRTNISEPTSFVANFITDNIPSMKLNGCFIHVRDDLEKYYNQDIEENHFKLRRID